MNNTEPARPSVTFAWLVGALLALLATVLLVLNALGWD